MGLPAPYDPLQPIESAGPRGTERPTVWSLYLAARGPRGPLFGGNVDWNPSPALVRKLLRAAALPFDGMNEHGLAVGAAQMPEAEPSRVPGRPVVGGACIQRLVLDQARTVARPSPCHNVEFEPAEPTVRRPRRVPS